MKELLPIVCKPTRWFAFRVLMMLLMLSVFAVLFYIDGSSGYRKKNLVFYLHRNFQTANEQFAAMKARGGMTADSWRAYAANQMVRLPDDLTTLPQGLKLPMPWPTVLHDYDKMLPMHWNKLWLEYSGQQGMSSNPPEQPYDAGKIYEQWVVFWICAGLSGFALFIFLRTMRRRIEVDAEGLRSAKGVKIPFGDMKRLDLRKWETKGLAFIDYEGSAGKGRARIDGLTYGGFKLDEDEPAERLMKFVRSKFSGEVIEYTTLPVGPEDEPKSGHGQVNP